VQYGTIGKALTLYKDHWPYEITIYSDHNDADKPSLTIYKKAEKDERLRQKITDRLSKCGIGENQKPLTRIIHEITL